MNRIPDIHFYLASTADPIDSDHPLWNRPLPRNREGAASFSDTSDILYREYFSAIAAFCASDTGTAMMTALSQPLGYSMTPDAISDIQVFLEKHGAFYHPARLVVSTEERRFSAVINVAASACGRATLPKEIRALSWLGQNRPFGWTPDVYADMRLPLPGRREISLFAGNWFDGHHEFHLTRSESGQENVLTVWDGEKIPTHLSGDQAAAAYQQAAMILSACYDPITTHQIFPWHHAAGDFVIRLTEDTVSVRLITVRDRIPIVRLSDEKDLDESVILDALMVFLIHLTLRMRLDRLDGVGEVVFAPETTVAPVVAGFFQGLDLCARLSGLPDKFPDFFRCRFSRYPADALDQLAETVMETFFPKTSTERRMVAHHLKPHLAAVQRQMSTEPSHFS